MGKRVAIVGARPPRGHEDTPSNRDIFRRLCALAHAFAMGLPAGTTIVSGGANGIDYAGASATLRRPRELDLVEHLPDYDKYPPERAPLERNVLIVQDCDELHAWPAPWSRGTWHTIATARRLKKPVTIHRLPEVKS